MSGEANGITWEANGEEYADWKEMKAVEETGNHIVHKIKLALIVIKICIVSLFLSCAIYQYVKKERKCSILSIILACYIVMLFTLLGMDITVKIIPIFFVLILMANYFNFVGFFFILRTLPSMEGRILRLRTKIYFWVMNCLYLAVVVCACIPGLEPLCTDTKMYPYVMNFASMLFIVNYLFHFVVNVLKKGNSKSLDRLTVQKKDVVETSDVASPDSSHEENCDETKLCWTHKQDSVTLRQMMFKRQMRFYLCFSTILVIINVGMQCYGRFYLSEGQLLGCTAGGYQWLYTTMTGELFITFHIVQIVMQAVMLEKALYKVPHESGWFETDHKHADLGSEDEDELDESEIQKMNQEGLNMANDKNDDDFKAVVN